MCIYVKKHNNTKLLNFQKSHRISEKTFVNSAPVFLFRSKAFEVEANWLNLHNQKIILHFFLILVKKPKLNR